MLMSAQDGRETRAPTVGKNERARTESTCAKHGRGTGTTGTGRGTIAPVLYHPTLNRWMISLRIIALSSVWRSENNDRLERGVWE